jgi:hypothetical protein
MTHLRIQLFDYTIRRILSIVLKLKLYYTRNFKNQNNKKKETQKKKLNRTYN